MSRAVRFSYRTTRPNPSFDPNTLLGLVFHVNSMDATANNAASGTGTGTFTKSGSTITFAATGIQSYHTGSTITFAGATTSGNNGSYTLATAGTGTCTFTNASGATESMPGGGTWSILGLCNTVTDRKSGFVFSSPGTQANAWSLNTSFKPGKQLLHTGENQARWLLRNNTDLASQFNGTGAFSYYTYYYLRSLSGSGCYMLEFRDANVGSAFTNNAYLRTISTAANHVYGRKSSAGTTTYPTTTPPSPLPVQDAWNSFGFTFDGGSTITTYSNGAVYGSQTTGGTVRTLASLNTTLISSGTNANTPGNGGKLYVAGVLVGTQAWSDTDFAKLHTYYSTVFA